MASEKGHTEVVKFLLNDSKVDPSYVNNYAIWIDSKKGYFEVFETLLGYPRVDLYDLSNRTIKIASENNHLSVVKFLINNPKVLNNLSERGIRYYKKRLFNCN